MELNRGGENRGFERLARIQPRIKRILIAVVILIVVIVVVVACVGRTGNAPTKDSKAQIHLAWDGNCPKKTTECPESFGVEPPPLLLVSLDGFRPDYLGKGFTPTLDRIGRCGVQADFVYPVFPTKTFPNHYTQVTGLYPAAHGIIDNSMFDPSQNKTFKLGKRSTFESFWWKAEPIWLTAQRQGRRSATFFWPGSDVEMNGTRPTFYRNYSSSVPFEARVDQVLEWLSLPSRPSLITLYLNEPDRAAHRHGTQSDQTKEALLRVDGIMERLLGGLQERNLTDCVNIFIMSDHGMSDIDCGRVLSLQKYINVSTVEATLGSFGRLRMKDNSSTTAEEEEEELMSSLRCQSDRLRVYRKEQLPVRMHYANSPRIEPIFIDIDSGWTLVSDNVSPEDWFCTGGAHGYDNLFPDMKALFIALGPSIKKNITIKPFLSVELYELMCELMDIVPNPNNGTRGSLHHVLRKPRRPLPSNAEPPPAPAKVDLPQYQEDYNERVEAAHCPCPQSYRQVVGENVLDQHAPFGIPQSPEELLVLHNRDYLLAYSILNRMPAWTTFTTQIIPSEEEDVCWTGDARIPINDTVKCTDFNSPLFLQRPLYPPAFSDPATRSEAFLVSNSLPKSLDHSSILEGEMVRILKQWAAESVQLNVLMGPAFDFFATGIKPTREDFKKQQSVHGRLLVPTHVFVIVTWCSVTLDRIADCHPSDLDAHSFLLPNTPYSENCQPAGQIIEKNAARIVDIEKLTGLTFFTELPPYEAIRLRTRMPQRTFL